MQQAFVSLVSLLLFSCALSSFAETHEVDVYQPKQEAHKLTIELSGNVAPEQNSELSALEAGLVKALFVEAGDKVVAGQALLSLDDTLAKLRLVQEESNYLTAQVQRQEAQRQYDEVVRLSKSKVVADSLLAERKANLASAKSSLSNSQARVSLQQEIVKRHTLAAPFDGVIARRFVNLGEWIGQQSQVFQLVSDQSLRLIVNLPQEHLRAITNQSEVTALVIPDVMPDKQFELPLTNIVAFSEPSSRTLQIRINLPNNTGLLPGMSARARFTLSDSSDSDSGSDSGSGSGSGSRSDTGTLSWIPRTALKRHPDGSNSVFIVQEIGKNSGKQGEQIVKRKKIKLVKSDMDRVAVTGLPIDSLVVVSGIELLKHNQSVKPNILDTSNQTSENSNDNQGAN